MIFNKSRFGRRRFSLFVVASLLLLPGVVAAQAAFPSKPITFVVPFPAGGATDTLARIWAESASKQLGVPIVVDNRAGANGILAMSLVAKAPADGYTLLLNTGSLSLNPFSYKTLPYMNSDFDGVAMLGTASQVLVVNPALGIKSIDDLVNRAKAKPNELAYGSGGIGNSTHLNVEILARNYGVKFLHTPYKGSAPAMLGLLSGDLQFMVDVVTTTVAQSRAGKVVPLAIFGRERIADLPGVPTIYELGLKNTLDGGWFAIAVPAGTPKAVIARLNATVVPMWQDPTAKERLAAANFTKLPETSDAAVKSYVDRDAKLWGPLITELGIKND
jgi:tripartite-type tricarboxylate transporter receptor subunit TctC